LLEEAVEGRVGDGWGDGGSGVRQFGVSGDDAPDHFLAALVDFQDVGAEGLLEEALVAQVVPESVHGRLGAQRAGHG
jgi:hypothetical protein